MLKLPDIPDLSANRKANFLAVGTALAVSLVAAAAALVFWLGTGPSVNVYTCNPGEDGRPEGLDALGGPTDMAGVFERLAEAAPEMPGAWVRFRGADSSNIVTNAPPLMDTWGDGGPRELWSVELGEGYAAPVVLDSRVYVLDYDDDAGADTMRCFALADGTELWRRAYEVTIKRNHGMSRTIPAITSQYLVTVGPRCHVVCLDTATGDFRWGIDLQRDYGTEEPLWYTGQCPIIEENRVIVAPCGEEVLMMAVDCATGDIAWTTPNPHGWNMSHSSIIPMTLLGKKTYVYCALGGIAGVSAEAADAGTLLWERSWDAKVVAPSPVQVGDDRVFMAAGYGKGSMMLRLTRESDTWSVETVFEKSPKEGLTCEQQTPLYHDGLLYGVMPKDAGGLKGQFVCYRPEGELVWSSGQDNRYGLGPFMLVNDRFFILDDDGVLTMLDAAADGFSQLAQTRVLDGHDAWGPIALAGTRMFLRDLGRMVCVDVGAANGATGT